MNECRNDQVRYLNVSELFERLSKSNDNTDSLLFEVLANPFSSDEQLQFAFEQASDNVLKMASVQACKTFLFNDLFDDYPVTDEALRAIFEGKVKHIHDKKKLQEILSSACKDDQLVDRIINL